MYEKQNDSHCEYTPLIKSETIIFDSAENDTTNPNNTEPQSNISIDSLLAELKDLVGLQPVKQEVSTNKQHKNKKDSSRKRVKST